MGLRSRTAMLYKYIISGAMWASSLPSLENIKSFSLGSHETQSIEISTLLTPLLQSDFVNKVPLGPLNKRHFSILADIIMATENGNY